VYCGDADTESLCTSNFHEWTASDPRIRVAQTATVESSSRANSGLDLTTGEFVAFLRAGDILAEQALYEVAFELGRDPDAISPILTMIK
jgi:hypothetical protein